jgi:hypothetical protein
MVAPIVSFFRIFRPGIYNLLAVFALPQQMLSCSSDDNSASKQIGTAMSDGLF